MAIRSYTGSNDMTTNGMLCIAMYTMDATPPHMRAVCRTEEKIVWHAWQQRQGMLLWRRHLFEHTPSSLLSQHWGDSLVVEITGSMR